MMIKSEVPIAVDISTPIITTSAGMIEESPADTEQSGEQPDEQPRAERSGRAAAPVDLTGLNLAGGAISTLIGQHADAGGDHHDCESKYQHRRG